MSTTIVHEIFYPAGGVAPNVPLVMQQAANSVEAALIEQEPDYVSVLGTVGQSIPNAVWTKGTFASTEDATTGTVDNAAGTITITKAGFYLLTASGGTASTTTGSFGVRIDLGASAVATSLAASSAAGSSGTASVAMFLAAGETVGYSIYQSSGAARTTTATPRLGVVRVAR
jgi:hypothetical protein